MAYLFYAILKLELWWWQLHFGQACRSGSNVVLLEIFLELGCTYLFGTLVVLLFRTLRSTIWTGRRQGQDGSGRGEKKEEKRRSVQPSI